MPCVHGRFDLDVYRKNPPFTDIEFDCKSRSGSTSSKETTVLQNQPFSTSKPRSTPTDGYFLTEMKWVGWRDVYKGIYELDYTVKCYFYWPSSIGTTQTKYASSTIIPFFEIDQIVSSCGESVTYTIHISESLLDTPYGMNPSPSGDR